VKAGELNKAEDVLDVVVPSGAGGGGMGASPTGAEICLTIERRQRLWSRVVIQMSINRRSRLWHPGLGAASLSYGKLIASTLGSIVR